MKNYKMTMTDIIIAEKVNKLVAYMEFTNKMTLTELKFFRQDLTRAMKEVAEAKEKETKK